MNRGRAMTLIEVVVRHFAWCAAERGFRRAVPPAVSATMVCLALCSCGNAHHGANVSRPCTSTVSISAPPSMSLTGDYDGDDDQGEQDRNDADNDDSSQPKDADNDSDSNGMSYFDRDDQAELGFGRAADSADRAAIAKLFERYFTAAAAGDGASDCSVLASALAASVAETLGGAAGPLYSRGSTCATVMSGLFRHFHRQLAAHAAVLRVADVRVKGNEGLAVLAFKGLPGRYMRVTRENGVWRLEGELDLELP